MEYEESAEGQLPDWAETLFEAAAQAMEFKGLGNVDGRYSAAEDNGWGVHRLDLAPGLLQISEQGPDDGAEVHAIIHSVDLLQIQEEFDEVESVSFDLENDTYLPEVTVWGKIDGKDVAVRIQTTPFEDAEAHTVMELPRPGGTPGPRFSSREHRGD